MAATDGPRCFLIGLLVLVANLVAMPVGAQVVDVELRNTLFFEPSGRSEMLVLNPEAGVTAQPADFLSITAEYSADVVSGASEAVKAGELVGPDIVSTASVYDFRHVAAGGVTFTKDTEEVSLGYSYGIENDYRSQSFTIAAATELFQRNTRLELGYGHGFDEVCDLELNARQAPTIRQRLDSSQGCFSGADDRRTNPVDLDNFQAGWTQTWTPEFVTQAVFTGALQRGFLSNPYRAVVVGPGGQQAQEYHPENRARMALAFRGRIYLDVIRGALGFGVRGYRDSWDILSGTANVHVESYAARWLRIRLRGRFYTQTGALFWSDDYTGGEPVTGPRGRYFTGDRELSPLRSYLVGASTQASWNDAGPFASISASLSVDGLKTDLLEFTWGGRTPDDTLALVGALALEASF